MLRGRDSIRGPALVALICACGLSLALATAAGGGLITSFKVKSTADAGAAGSTSDAVCTSTLPAGTCTLRAAIEEANGSSGFNAIQFSSAVAGHTIGLGDELDIESDMGIDGCSSDPGHVGPCVGVRPDDDANNAFNINSVSGGGVQIRGLAITNANVGVYAEGSDPVTLQNNRFGIKRNGAVEGNEGGGAVLIDSDDAQVGGDTSAERNLFSANPIALYIQDGDFNTVQGNRFGTMPDGTGSAPNEENIRLVGLSGGGGANNNLIGGTVSASQAGTAKCDGVCNLIVNANGTFSGHGIDLTGGEGSEIPAEDTTIAGNFIGLSKGGGSDKGNSGDGVLAANTTGTTIGGESSRDRNFISGNGQSGIDACCFSGTAVDLLIQRNYIGLSSSGAGAVPNQGDPAILMHDGEVDRNRIGGDPDNDESAIVILDATSVSLTGNVLGIGTNGANRGFDGDAIRVSVATNVEIGGGDPGEGNTIANAEDDGIDMYATNNSTIAGNLIGTDSDGADRGNDGDGIDIFGDADEDDPSNENVIGGSTAAEENVISNSGDDAIDISGADAGDADENFIIRNRGKNNGSGPNDLFIDLGPAPGYGNGPAGANAGVTAPDIFAGSPHNAFGFSVEPNGSVVFIFRTKSPGEVSPNRIEAFVGTAVVSGGVWSTEFPDQPAGQSLTALQVVPGKGSSELALAYAY